MVAQLSETPGFKAVSPSIIQQDPQPAETDPIVTNSLGPTQDPSPSQGSTPSHDVSQASAVQPLESGDAPAAASRMTPSPVQTDFFAQLGNVLSSLITPEGDKEKEQPQVQADTPDKVKEQSAPVATNTPTSDGAKEEPAVPELKGYKSVLDVSTMPDPHHVDIGEKDRQAIRTIESGSAKGNYNAIGKPTRTGDRAYGAYQVMGANIPSWTKKYLGKSMSIAQFRADPAAQDKVFAGEFGRLKAKYGGAGAAQAWFAGEAGMKHKGAKDVNGTSVGQYASMYTKFYNA